MVNAISVVRHRALAIYVRTMVKYLNKPLNIDGLCGTNYLVISNVKIEGIEEWFGDIKLDHDKYTMATFTPISDGKWKFEFNDLGPSDNYIYLQAAYKSITEFLAYAFDADIELCTWLND